MTNPIEPTHVRMDPSTMTYLTHDQYSDFIAARARRDVLEGIVDGANRQLVEAHMKLDELEKDFLDSKAANRELQEEHEKFRTDVRNLAILKAQELNWCDTGLNEALEQLGLEPKEDKNYRIVVRVYAFQDVELEIVGRDEDEVREKLNDDDFENEVWNNIEERGWEQDTTTMEPSIKIQEIYCTS